MPDAAPAVRTLGGPIARRELHVVYLLDRSGSMNADGKIQALNVAMTESLPLLRDAARDNIGADVRVRVVTFSDGAAWVAPEAEPVDTVRWSPIDADGFTDLGAALDLVAAVMESPPMPERALAPVLILVSDGQPTDDHRGALNRLLATTWGARSLRLAVAIGHGADREVLQEFIGAGAGIAPARADDPEAIVEQIQWATAAATRAGTALRPAATVQVFSLDDAETT